MGKGFAMSYIKVECNLTKNITVNPQGCLYCEYFIGCKRHLVKCGEWNNYPYFKLDLLHYKVIEIG
jgi:hypothetical protein